MTGADYLCAHEVDLAVAIEECGTKVSDDCIRYRCEDPHGEVFYRTRYLTGEWAGETRGPKGRSLCLSWPEGRRGGAVVLTEGEVDGLSTLSALRASEGSLAAIIDGLVVAAAPGAMMPASRAAEELRDAGADVVYIAFDGDDPGRKGAERIAEALAEIGITALIVGLPSGSDLSDEMVAAERPAARLADLLSQHSTPWAREEAPKLEPPKAEEDAGSSPGDAQSERKPSQGEILLKLAHEAGVELWATSEGDPMMTVPVGQHIEHHRLGTRAARDWLGYLFYGAQERPPSAQAVQDTLGVLRGEALYAGERVDAPVRYTATEDATYLDLGDPEWRAVEITADGWRIVAEPPVRFRRPRGALALPDPVTGGSLKVLREMLNVDEEGWRLIVGFLVGTMAPHGPYPLLCFEGEAGSAKSTAARRIRELTDPNVAPLRSEPRDERDLAIAAANGRIIALDNVSRITPTLSDALCRLATGGAYATRELFSDTEETLLAAVRPAIITGITEVITRGDLADRALKVTLSPISDEDRRPEAELDDRWEELRPIALGALLDATVTALRRLPDIRPDRLPRLADHARWVMAAEPALGWEDGAYLAAYEDARVLANESALESSPLTAPLKLIASAGFEGTATDLLERIENLADDDAIRAKSWPRSARSLSGMLRRLAPSLRDSGIGIAFTRDEKRRLVTVQEGVDPDRHVRHDRQEDAPPRLSPDANDAADANDGPNGSFLSQEGPPDLASCDDEAEAERVAEKFGVAI